MERAAIDQAIESDGYAILRGVDSANLLQSLLQGMGVVVAEEEIALRPGAHAYVARPGPVPLHTDQPQVEIVCWHCLEQDDVDGASLLLDSRPTVERLSARERAILRQVQLVCPPVAGGAPVLRFPVLRRARRTDLVFASPWLKPAVPSTAHQAALDQFRQLLSEAASEQTIEVRLMPGDVLLVDNQRVLHGRRKITSDSRRRLHRRWIIRHETAALE